MREKKNFIFYNEAAEGGNEAREKNTVQAFLKTLQDTHNNTTTGLLQESASIDFGIDDAYIDYDYRTEVPAGDAAVPRYLVGVSASGRVRPGSPGDSEPRIDGRIRVFDTTGANRELVAEVYLEAKVGRDELGKGQLDRYANNLEIPEDRNGGRWTALAWADVYSGLRGLMTTSDSAVLSSKDKYLLTELTDWLRYRELVQQEVASYTTTDSSGRKHLSELFVGIDQSDELFLRLNGESWGGGEQRKSGDVRKLREQLWKKVLDKIDEERRETTFGVPSENDSSPTPDLNSLREWALEANDHTESQYDGQDGKWVLDVDTPEERLRLKFRRGDQVWFRDRSSGTRHYCPNLSPEEFAGLFNQIDPSVRRDVFVHGNLDPLWGTHR